VQQNFEQYCCESAKSCETIPDVHAADFIFRYIVSSPIWASPRDAIWYYFSDGRNSARKLRDILVSDLGIAPNTPLSLLEFASGYGCVTRHLPRILPNVSIVASDIHPEANEFIRQKTGVKSIQSTSIPENFTTTFFYDVIFVLSFFSHMPKSTWTRWLKVLSDQLNVNGHLIFTAHGLITVRKSMPNLQFDQEGFHFHEASEQDDLTKAEYGTTVTTPSFVSRAVELLDNCEVSIFKSGFWWGHQDLWVIRKRFPDGIDPVGHIDICSLIAQGGTNVTRPILPADGWVVSAPAATSVADEVVITGTDVACPILQVEGWVIPGPSAASVADEVIMIIDMDDGQRYFAATDPYNRPDISNCHSNPALLRSGFKTTIDIRDLKSSGTIKVAMLYNGQWIICPLNEKRIVR
jgi:hypothetical protein